MGKKIEIKLEGLFLKNNVKIIRRKEDIIILLLKIMKLLLIKDYSKDDIKGKVILKIDKMSRLIFETENKYFSFNFPFAIEIDELSDSIKIFDSILNVEIDEILISTLIGIFNRKLESDNSLEDIFYEFIYEFGTFTIDDVGFDADIIRKIVEKLSMFECGYLRYDYDIEHQDGYIHPINHIDVNYSGESTFKLGLKNKITIEEFIDILDLRTNCYHLNKV